MIDLRGKTVFVLSENDIIHPADLVRPLFGRDVDFMHRDSVHDWLAALDELPYWVGKTLMDFHVSMYKDAEDWQDKSYIHQYEIVRIVC